MQIYSTIKGTGRCIPSKTVTNEDFLTQVFLDADGRKIPKDNTEIIQKFKDITTISTRQYAEDHQVTSDLAMEAAREAIRDADIPVESLDHIIVAHNFGDVRKGSNRSDQVPSLAARVKQKLGIQKPSCVAYDMLFGCPGWLQAVIQADYYIRAGDAEHVLVIGAETLSRVVDPHDRDTMLFADGAGAVVLAASPSDTPHGILGHVSQSDALEYAHLLSMAKGNDPQDGDNVFMKMQGRKLYEYALTKVPQAIKSCLDKCQLHIRQIAKVFLHQANGKMDHAILERLYKLYEGEEVPQDVMPMTVDFLGNSSVATLPTLLDLVRKTELHSHLLSGGQYILFASVGAGMNINALAYRVS